VNVTGKFCRKQITTVQQARPGTVITVQQARPVTGTTVQRLSPKLNIVGQKSGMKTCINLESMQTRFKVTSTNQNAPSDLQILKLVTKIVTQDVMSDDKDS